MLYKVYIAICHINSLGVVGDVLQRFSLSFWFIVENVFFRTFLGVWVMRGASLSSVVSSAGDVIRWAFWGGGALIVFSLGDR